MDHFQNVGIVDLYRSMGLEHNLVLDFLINTTEKHYRGSSISELYGTAIESGLQISREGVERVVNELEQCDFVYRCRDCEMVSARPEGMLYSRRN